MNDGAIDDPGEQDGEAPEPPLATKMMQGTTTAPERLKMPNCTNSPSASRTGCGQSFSGELQHCVARASWSRHPDGRAHVTASRSVIDDMWSKGDGSEPADPATIGYLRDPFGRWRSPSCYSWPASLPVDMGPMSVNDDTPKEQTP